MIAMCPAAVPSVTEGLLALTPAGVGALAFALPVALAIAGLIAVVATSYWQTIHAYLSGGGAYIVVLANLRGVRESGRIFAIPTYAFLATLGFLVLLGLLALATEGRAGPPSLPSPGGTVSLFLILRAFAYLVLYNALFVLPLGVILVAASARPTLNRLGRWNLHHREGMRLGMGLGVSALGLIILAIV